MSNKLIKFRPEWFAGYGLAKEKNFLQSPECECGCGGKVSLLLKDTKELFGFMFNMLMENDCEHCGLFAHAFDGNMYAALKVENESGEPVLFFAQQGNMKFFKELDDEIDLHCYGLIIETRKGEWKIIED